MQSKPKKNLGQNFLWDTNIQRKIIKACDFCSSDTVLEIGAGIGVLTALIATNTSKVYALEIDSSLIPVLAKNLKGSKNINIINQDILKFNLDSLKEAASLKMKVFGNIPYYITSPIIEYLLKFRHKIKVIFLTVQKEFAQRIIAKPDSEDYGSFSCFVQYYTEPEILFFIKKNSFYPTPKVDSCFLRLMIREKPAVAVNDENLFFKIIRQSFQQRRKTLKNSLKSIILPQKLEEFFKRYKINPKIRAEELSIEDFANLVRICWTTNANIY